MCEYNEKFTGVNRPLFSLVTYLSPKLFIHSFVFVQTAVDENIERFGTCRSQNVTRFKLLPALGRPPPLPAGATSYTPIVVRHLCYSLYHYSVTEMTM